MRGRAIIGLCAAIGIASGCASLSGLDDLHVGDAGASDGHAVSDGSSGGAGDGSSCKSCPPGEGCCPSGRCSSFCASADGGLDPDAFAFECASPNDCPDVCCLPPGASIAFCAASCDNGREVCDPDAPTCGRSQSCSRVSGTGLHVCTSN